MCGNMKNNDMSGPHARRVRTTPWFSMDACSKCGKYFKELRLSFDQLLLHLLKESVCQCLKASRAHCEHIIQSLSGSLRRNPWPSISFLHEDGHLLASALHAISPPRLLSVTSIYSLACLFHAPVHTLGRFSWHSLMQKAEARFVCISHHSY